MSTSNLCRGCMNLTNINPINSLLEFAFKDIFEKCTGLQVYTNFVFTFLFRKSYTQHFINFRLLKPILFPKFYAMIAI